MGRRKANVNMSFMVFTPFLTYLSARPRAMLSDFGTSRDMLRSSSNRSGNTGTFVSFCITPYSFGTMLTLHPHSLEYTSPESLPSPLTGLLKQIDSKADMWSLGMILHKLLFFRLPYRYAAQGDANGESISTDREGDKLERLGKEVLGYPGYPGSLSLTYKLTIGAQIQVNNGASFCV